MMHHNLRKTAAALTIAATALSFSGSAMAQPDQGATAGPVDQGQYGPGRGQYNVPPPPGYQPNDDQYETSSQAREEDQRYTYEAEQWAAQNCMAERANNTAAGAVIGGILGAIIGGGMAGRYNRGAGVVVGGALGATAGAAVGNSASNNPNCPPGYVVRPGAPGFYSGPFYGGVIYAAPPWYDPWIWYGSHWIYRPYPYHRYWYRTHPR
jgi:hypothetical protein